MRRIACSVCEAQRLVPEGGPTGACSVCGFVGYEDVDREPVLPRAEEFGHGLRAKIGSLHQLASGQVLVVALLVCVAFSLVGSAVVALAVAAGRGANGERDRLAAFACADAGVSLAVEALKDGTLAGEADVAGGHVEWTADPLESLPGSYVITAQGKANGITQIAQARWSEAEGVVWLR